MLRCINAGRLEFMQDRPVARESAHGTKFVDKNKDEDIHKAEECDWAPVINVNVFISLPGRALPESQLTPSYSFLFSTFPTNASNFLWSKTSSSTSLSHFYSQDQ